MRLEELDYHLPEELIAQEPARERAASRLLVCARDLLRDEAGVRAELQTRFTHYFVDEFQDTDPLQAEILLLLAADDPAETDWHRVAPRPGKLFLVGDPKQSIYRFRRADVAIYEGVKRQLAARGAAPVRALPPPASAPASTSGEGGPPPLGGERHGESAPTGGAVHGGDDRLGRAPHQHDDLAHLTLSPERALHGAAAGARDVLASGVLLQVEPGAECAIARTGENQDIHGAVGLELAECRGQLPAQLA